ncbi:hypothetical protein E9Z77_002213 [Escherichia coli]|uniref:hypothetical protein n=1 Tax=Escherichia coli TaxID=562 RepID=UPI003BF778DF|nr:hypothetical protein [Escherichia coli]
MALLAIFAFIIFNDIPENWLRFRYSGLFDFYKDLERWLAWTAWFSISVGYFSSRLLVLRGLICELERNKQSGSIQVEEHQLIILFASIIGISFFIPALESISQLIVYMSIPDKLKLIYSSSIPIVEFIHLSMGIVLVIICNVYFNKAFKKIFGI